MFENKVDVGVALLAVSVISHKVSKVQRDFTMERQYTPSQSLTSAI
jgi:hypothetical protein